MSQLGIGMTDVSHDEMHRERQSKRAVAIAGAVVVALLAVTTIFVVRLFTGSDEFPGPGTGSVVVEVKPGSSLSPSLMMPMATSSLGRAREAT